MKTIQTLAQEGSSFMTTDKRPDGSTFWKTADNCPEWLTDLVRSAHGEFLPDDYRYRWIAHALDAFASEEDPDRVIDYLEPDPYNFDLLTWCASNLYRMAYVDEAIADGSAQSLSEALSWGQLSEIRETYHSVFCSLEALTETEEA